MGQADVGDGGVEHLHERRHRDDDRDEPRRPPATKADKNATAPTTSNVPKKSLLSSSMLEEMMDPAIPDDVRADLTPTPATPTPPACGSATACRGGPLPASSA